MKNNIYYGEYSLKHWIQLLLKRDIVLPEYQRSFVWDEPDITRLIKSFQEKQFVQPVTIALFNPQDRTFPKNLLIDGQQRLTSILLAKLGFLPNRDKFREVIDIATEDNDMTGDVDAIAEARGRKGPIEWTFEYMLQEDLNNNSIHAITERLSIDEKYTPFNFNVNQDFFENNFLGFSYIVPDSDNEQEIQRSFSQLFRNINYFGKKLSPIESRRSLYYLNEVLRSYFEGTTTDGSHVFGNLMIMENVKPVSLDFVRYLAILSQYSLQNSSNNVMVGYSIVKNRESFYADYVAYIVGIEQEERTDKFNNFDMEITFPNKCWKSRFDNLKQAINLIKTHFRLNEKGAFVSWIDADYWLFGLIYEVVFKNKSIVGDVNQLCHEIQNRISVKRHDEEYSRKPNMLGNLRRRLAESINTYSRYVR